MKKFVLMIVLFGLSVCSFLTAACFLLPDAGIKKTLLGVELIKRELLRTTPGKRIVFIGGSNVSHGIDSEMVAQAFKRPVINMGLHAGFGLVYNLASALPYLREGDDVFLLPEDPNFFGSKCYGQLEALAAMVDVVPRGSIELSWRHWLYLSQYFLQYGAKKVRNITDAFVNKPPIWLSYYDKYGDYVITRKTSMQEQFFEATMIVHPYDLHPEIATSYLRAFYDACKAKGVRVFIMPPNRFDGMFEGDISSKYVEIFLSTGIPYIGDVERYAFPRDCMYDTIYHLNNKGRALAMPRRIADMRKAFGMGVDSRGGSRSMKGPR